MDYMEMFDTVPFNEKCAESEILEDQKKEARRYRDLLVKAHPAPIGCSLRIKSNPHDFGSYISLEAWGDEDNDEHWDWVNSLSRHTTWAALEIAAKKMKLYKRSLVVVTHVLDEDTNEEVLNYITKDLEFTTNIKKAAKFKSRAGVKKFAVRAEIHNEYHMTIRSIRFNEMKEG